MLRRCLRAERCYRRSRDIAGSSRVGRFNWLFSRDGGCLQAALGQQLQIRQTRRGARHPTLSTSNIHACYTMEIIPVNREKRVDRPTTCAHDELKPRGRYDGTTVDGATLLAGKCAECCLLLQIIDHFKPGWIADAIKYGKGRIEIHVWSDTVYTIQLLPDPCTPIRWPHQSPVEEFEFFFRSNGRCRQR